MAEDVKGDLLGRVNTRRTGKNVVNAQHLHAPFEGPVVGGLWSVAYRFCKGCGLIAEVNEPQARRLAAEAGTPFDGLVPSGIYFETDGCPFCGDRETHTVEVKPLPPVGEPA